MESHSQNKRDREVKGTYTFVQLYVYTYVQQLLIALLQHAPTPSQLIIFSFSYTLLFFLQLTAECCASFAYDLLNLLCCLLGPEVGSD